MDHSKLSPNDSPEKVKKRARQKLQADLLKLHDDPPVGIHAEMIKNNLFQWDVVMFGPGNTCFHGGCFRLRMEFPSDYPSRPPKATFYSRMFHPNVYANGNICLDVIQSKWKSTFDASTALIAIQGMLGDPNPNSPANAEAKRLYVDDNAAYEKRVKEIVVSSQREDPQSAEKNLNTK